MKNLHKIIKSHIGNQRRYIRIGRSYNSAGIGSGTPINIIDSDSEPKLLGHPYLKTTFRNGNFSKTLYTPSTLRVEVGKDWLKKHEAV